MTDSTCDIARFLAYYGVRNSALDNLHAGTEPSSVVGDYSDVKVVSPYGEIPWRETSRISDEEMRDLMLSVEEQIRGYLSKLVTAGVISVNPGPWSATDLGDWHSIAVLGPTYDRKGWPDAVNAKPAG